MPHDVPGQTLRATVSVAARFRGCRMSDETTATSQTDQAITQTLSTSLWADLASIQTFSDAKPLLAHYTSSGTLEAILRNKMDYTRLARQILIMLIFFEYRPIETAVF